MKAKNQ